MEIFISQNNERTGPFTPQEIQTGLASGLYKTSDLIWYKGLDDWKPLSESLHILNSPPTIQPHFQPANSGLATASLILGISGFFCLITSIPAIICGHIARSNIKESQGRIGGSGMALAGLITGYLGFGIVLIACIAALTAPLIMSQIKKADQVEAITHAKQIGLALDEFKEEYGSYPNAETAKLVAQETSTPEITGDSSNHRFRQLIASGIVFGEEIFYAKSPNTRKPDGDISGDNAIAPRECGFGYIHRSPVTEADFRPIVMAPFIPGTTKFDPAPFDGKAIILWTDNSVRSVPIDRTTGDVIIDGKSILDPTHPVWNGTPPHLLLPE
ncbi:MAG: DUF4190 domain-containing protein [Verrucomicrobiota bacterium]